MIRAVTAIAAGLICGMIGLRLSSSLRQEAQQAQRWCGLLQRLELLIAEGTLPLPDALRAAADGASAPDRLLQDVADALAGDPLTPLQEAFSAHCPPCAGRDDLLRLFGRLGRGSAQSRLLALEQASQAMTLTAQEASARAERDAKLWRTLGWTGGACLTILLL